jgi:hypothetical protein
MVQLTEVPHSTPSCCLEAHAESSGDLKETSQTGSKVCDAPDHDLRGFREPSWRASRVDLPASVPPFEIVLQRLQVFLALPSLVLNAAEL